MNVKSVKEFNALRDEYASTLTTIKEYRRILGYDAPETRAKEKYLLNIREKLKAKSEAKSEEYVKNFLISDKNDFRDYIYKIILPKILTELMIEFKPSKAESITRSIKYKLEDDLELRDFTVMMNILINNSSEFIFALKESRIKLDKLIEASEEIKKKLNKEELGKDDR